MFQNVQNIQLCQARSADGGEPAQVYLLFTNNQKKYKKDNRMENLMDCFNKKVVSPPALWERERGMITMIHLASSRPWESVPDQHREDEGRVLSVHLLEPGFVVIWIIWMSSIHCDIHMIWMSNVHLLEPGLIVIWTSN